jgi:hypothetical protein
VQHQRQIERKEEFGGKKKDTSARVLINCIFNAVASLMTVDTAWKVIAGGSYLHVVGAKTPTTARTYGEIREKEKNTKAEG